MVGAALVPLLVRLVAELRRAAIPRTGAPVRGHGRRARGGAGCRDPRGAPLPSGPAVVPATERWRGRCRTLAATTPPIPLPDPRRPAVPATTDRQLADLQVTLHTGERTRLSALAAGGSARGLLLPESLHRRLHGPGVPLPRPRCGVRRARGVPRRREPGRRRDPGALRRGARLRLPAHRRPGRQVAKLFGAKRPGPLWSKRQTFVLDRDLAVLAAISSETDMEKHADEALAGASRRSGLTLHATAAAVDGDALGFEQIRLSTGVARRQTPSGSHHPPPGQLHPAGGQDPTDRAGSPRVTDLGRHLAVRHDLPRLRSTPPPRRRVPRSRHGPAVPDPDRGLRRNPAARDPS